MGPGGGASKRSVLGAVTRKGRTSKNRVLNIGSVAGGPRLVKMRWAGFGTWQVFGGSNSGGQGWRERYLEEAVSGGADVGLGGRPREGQDT